MSTATTTASEQDVIAKVVQHYIDGAKSGRGDDMRSHSLRGVVSMWLTISIWRAHGYRLYT